MSLLPMVLLTSWLVSFGAALWLQCHSVLPPESPSRLEEPSSSLSVPSSHLDLVAPSSPVAPSVFPIGSP
ncbi:hypothetical protein PR002_g23359 [Phytophthora rubi]|uniref:RxLR effector protein n=1 Tax=Phytophthora rubi TaxID=129364 RepID=A0A6A3IR82_9STRA|nr:hypothetical protein PR002_g23359 [Phytophthora rubi]